MNKFNPRVYFRLGQSGSIFGMELMEQAGTYPFKVLSSDMSVVAGLDRFKKEYPDNFYNVGIAEDGEKAINIIKANQGNDFIEAILLDINMPKVDGFAVLDYMKKNNLLKKMPVSIISGDSSKDTIDRAFEYQIVDMLGKPFNDQSIKMVIEKTLFFKEMNNK